MMIRLLAGELAGVAEQNAREHLASCAGCRDRRGAMIHEHDSWIRELSRAGPPRFAGELRTGAVASDSIAPPIDLIHGYDILDEIGRGGQGIIYRALQRGTRRTVAIKVLREGPFAERATRARFEREIEIVAGFNHPGIVTVFDSSAMPDGRMYCVMDLVEGQPIDTFIRETTPTLNQTLTLFQSVCEAVNYAHQRGVIHRDLKPSNILVDQDGRPRILDFGMAKRTEDSDATLATQTGIVTGTLPFLSPEQAAGRQGDVDIRSDVYALGVVLYVILCDKHPYPITGDLGESLRHIVESAPIRLQLSSRFLNSRTREDSGTGSLEDLKTIVFKSLAKERERRYQTAGDLASDLAHFLSGRPIAARRDSGLYLLRSALRRHRAAVIVSMVFLLTITGSVVALAILYGRQSELLDQVQREKRVSMSAESRATQRLQELRELMRTFIFQLDGKLQGVPGAIPARELVMDTALKYLKEVAKEVGEDDDQMLAELGTAYLRLGDILGKPSTANMGEPERAVSLYQAAIEHIQKLVGKQPDALEPRAVLWTVCTQAAQVQRSLQREDEALAMEATAARQLSEMTARFPDDPTVQRNVLYVQRGKAEQLELQHRSPEALAAYQDCLKMALKLRNRNPDDLQLWHDVGQLHSRLAKIEASQGQTDEAITSIHKAVECLRHASENSPPNSRLELDVAVALDQQGVLLNSVGRTKDALQAFEASRQAARRLVDLDANDARAWGVVQTALCRIGELEMASGKWRDAQRTFGRHLEAARQTLRLTPDSAPARRELAIAHFKLYELNLGMAENEGEDTAARWAAAHDALLQALEIFERLKREGALEKTDASVPEELRTALNDLDAKRRSSGE